MDHVQPARQTSVLCGVMHLITMPGKVFAQQLLVPEITMTTLMKQHAIEPFESSVAIVQYHWASVLPIDMQQQFLTEALPHCNQRANFAKRFGINPEALAASLDGFP